MIYLFINDNKNEKSIYTKWSGLPLKQQVKKAGEHLKIVEKTNNFDEIIEAYYYLGDCYYKLFRFNESLNCFTKAYQLSEMHEGINILPDITYKLAINYLDIGEYTKAHMYAIKTDSIERKRKSRSAETLNLLGNIYEKSGLYVKALAVHYESLELQKANKNEVGIANSYHNLAHIYMAGQRFDKAYTFYNNALEIYEKLSLNHQDSLLIKISVGKIKLSIGNYFIIQNDSSDAFRFLSEALDIFKQEKNEIEVAQTLLYYGNYYLGNRNFEKAIDYYIESLKISTKTNNKIAKAAAKLNISKVFYLQGNVEKAKELLKKNVALTSEIGAKRQFAETVGLLYSIYMELPDSSAQITQYAKLHFTSKKYLPNNETQDSIIQMSVHYEVTAQKNEEIEVEKYKQKSQIIILISLLIIIVHFCCLLFLQKKFKTKRQYEIKIAEEQLQRFKEVVSAIENERKRIAIDLHDSLGQMLSTTKLYLSGLEDVIENQSETNRKLYSDTINLLDNSCSELRNISYNIMPSSFIKYGLIASINELISKINDSELINIVFDNNVTESNYDETLEILVYRIVQEALNNIIKHSKATHVNLNFYQKNNVLYLSIKDNGKGMDDIGLFRKKGLGWKSIFSRIEMLEGTIDVITGINKGTEIKVEIPLQNNKTLN
ncbi:MAG: tetratricopeptide repeat protein [Chloroflexia bacterium]|nr:tetratricopeptide repeat protein [Chloroflexia bacterium]